MRTLFFLTIILFGLSACNSTNYHQELTENFGIWNSTTHSIDGLYGSAEAINSKDGYSNLSTIISNTTQDVNNRIKNLEARQYPDEDVKSINIPLIEYLKAEVDVLTAFSKLSENAKNMTDEEFNTAWDEIDKFGDIALDKATILKKAQDEYAKKHNITIKEF